MDGSVHVQALEVAHRVQQAYMHLHADEQSDEEDSMHNIAVVHAQISGSAAATPVASITKESSGNVEVGPCTSAHSQQLHDMGAAGCVDGGEQQPSAAGTDSVSTAALGVANADYGAGPSSAPALDTIQQIECPEKGPQLSSEASQRTASVQHFLAHMEVAPPSYMPP